MVITFLFMINVKVLALVVTCVIIIVIIFFITNFLFENFMITDEDN